MTEQVRFRIVLLGALIFGLFVAMGLRLWYLQVVSQETFEVQARANLERTVPIPATRGRILDVNGRVLVGNRVTNLVSVDKFILEQEAPTASQRAEIALKLAEEISQTGRLIKASAIEEAFNDPKYGPFDTIPIATDVTEEFAILLGERLEDFPGVEVAPTTIREYPFGQLAVHILGTIGPITGDELAVLENHPKTYTPNDSIGKTGIERSFEDVLRGQPGERVIEVDALNRVVSVVEETPPIPGADVQLTIDIDYQRMIEEELRIGIEAARTRTVENADPDVPPSKELHRATGGAMVLLDPDGSRVIAMASYPTYDPEPFIGGISQEEYDLLNDEAAFAPLFNRAVAGIYSPGSTFKPFTSYAAMDTGMLGDRGFLEIPQFTEDNGWWRIPDCETADCYFQNAGAEPFGDVDLERAITVSSDVYYYQMAYQFDVRSGFDSDSIQQAAALFGFGRTTGVQLPEDRAGLVPDESIKRERHEANPEAFPDGAWTAGDTLNVSIGQGDMGVTPLQMANAYGVLANGGTLYSPQIVDRIVDQVTDEPLDVFGPRIIDELYFPDWMRRPLMRGLAGVTADREGTAYEVFEDFPMLRYPVAGKTGTIETEGKQDSSAFAAFGPLPESEFVAYVHVEEGGFGARTAAPIVRAVFDKIESGDIAEAPTAQQIEEYYQSVVLSGADEDDESLPTGDVVEDIARGLDTTPELELPVLVGPKPGEENLDGVDLTEPLPTVLPINTPVPRPTPIPTATPATGADPPPPTPGASGPQPEPGDPDPTGVEPTATPALSSDPDVAEPIDPDPSFPEFTVTDAGG